MRGVSMTNTDKTAWFTPPSPLGFPPRLNLICSSLRRNPHDLTPPLTNRRTFLQAAAALGAALPFSSLAQSDRRPGEAST